MNSSFQNLKNILETLLGPNGCPWDREQTLDSLCSSLLEETCETIDAINLSDNDHIKEELGDLFFNVLFLCLVGEKENRFKLDEVLEGISNKLIRRHPHIFGEMELKTSEEVAHQWEEIKKREKKDRQNILEGIPQSLPALARANQVLKKLQKENFKVPSFENNHFTNDEELGQMLLTIVMKAREKKIDPEKALRKSVALLEKNYLDALKD